MLQAEDVVALLEGAATEAANQQTPRAATRLRALAADWPGIAAAVTVAEALEAYTTEGWLSENDGRPEISPLECDKVQIGEPEVQCGQCVACKVNAAYAQYRVALRESALPAGPR